MKRGRKPGSMTLRYPNVKNTYDSGGGGVASMYGRKFTAVYIMMGRVSSLVCLQRCISASVVRGFAIRDDTRRIQAKEHRTKTVFETVTPFALHLARTVLVK